MINISKSQFVEGDAGTFFMRFKNPSEIKITFTPSKKTPKLKNLIFKGNF
jgi:hypothetical protein